MELDRRLSPGWISLEPHLDGVLAVAVAATISLVCIFALVSFIALLLFKHYRNTTAEERRDRRIGSKAIRFLASTHGLLFLDLLLGDLLQAIGFFLNYSWYRHGALPPTARPTALCTTQGILIQIGDTASAFSSFIITLNLFSVIVFSKHPSVKALSCVMVLQWVVVAVLALIGPRWLQQSGKPFYADAGAWCWISSHYSSARLWLHYFFVFVIAFLDLVLYSVIALFLILQARRTSSKVPAGMSSVSGVAKIMFLFPIGYIITILPLSSYRAASMAGKKWGMDAQLAAGFVFTLSGAVDCIIYATTRSIISKESVGAIRRGSQSATFTNSGGPGATKHRKTLRGFFFSSPSRKSSLNPSSKTSTLGPQTSGIRVQVETEVYLPSYNQYDPSPTSPSFPQDVQSSQHFAAARTDYERTKKRDFEREREMELDRRTHERFEPVERPFASLRQVDQEAPETVHPREQYRYSPGMTESIEKSSFEGTSIV
ncbi:uncharacterized protein JCM15063_004707 [Sporobolomyces koalae]|uniref:uncharacterized protein n=1 Tax=Sporobolomyces koalae TaxID=500713 RepID=UPI00317EAA6F